MGRLIKQIAFFGVILFFNQLQAAPTCELAEANFMDLVNVTESAKNCEEVNKAATCTEHKIDPNAIQKMITTHLETTMSAEFMEKTKKDFREWDRYFSINPFYSRFYHYDETEKSKNLPPTPILNWLNDKEFASQGVEATELKKNFINKYVEFAKKMDCTPQINQESIPMELNIPKRVNSTGKQKWEYDRAVEEFKKNSRSPETIKEVKEQVAKINENGANNLTLCSDRLWEPREYHTIAYKYPPCAGNFKQYFNDNAFKISQSSLAEIMADDNAKELVACIKERTAQGAKINHITISASSSSLNNGGEAAKKFCAKGFKELSEARALSAKEVILPAVFEGSGTDLSKLGDIVQISNGGANGNGTSGPCVYEKNASGSEVLKPEVLKALALADKKKKNPATKIDEASQAIIESLEEAKYVSVQVTFDENTIGAKEQQHGYSSRVGCRRLRFSCPAVQK